MQKPGIPAQQMQRTGTRERACGSGTALQHAPQHALQPRSIAWGGGGEAAMKGGAHLAFARELLHRVPPRGRQQGARLKADFTPPFVTTEA